MAHEHTDSCDHGNPFADLDEDTQRQIQEIQILEHNYQQLMMQKQNFDFELNETAFALKELENAEGDVFKIVGNQVIIKTPKKKLTEELSNKKELIESRLKQINNQESQFSEKINDLREEIMKKISPPKSKK